MNITIKFLFTAFVFFIQSTQCGWLKRVVQNFAVHAAQNSCADLHNHTIDAQDLTNLNDNVAQSIENYSLATRVGYHAHGRLELLGEHIRYSKRTPFRETLAEELSGIPCAGTRLVNNHYDFSKIKRLAKITPLTKNNGKLSMGNYEVPCIMKHTLPNGKKVWFFCDIHNEKISNECAKKALSDETFSNVIIECNIWGSSVINNGQMNSFTKYLKSAYTDPNKDSSMDTAINLFKNSANTSIKPVEFLTDYQELEAYKKKGIKEFQLTIMHNQYSTDKVQKYAKEMYTLIPDKQNCSDEQFTITYQNGRKIFFTAESLLANYHLINKDINAYVRVLQNKSVYMRDTVMIESTIDTADNPDDEGNTVIVIGAAHYFTQQLLLEEYLGKGKYIGPQEILGKEAYNELIKKNNKWSFWPF